MIRVYIMSPYSKGDAGTNLHRAMVAFNNLADMGFAPYGPLLSHFQHICFPRPYEYWLELDIEWLRVCDVAVRLPGDSKGADHEEYMASYFNIPVYRIHEDFLRGDAIRDHINKLAVEAEIERQKIR